MPRLYTLRLSRPVKGMVAGPVKAEYAAGIMFHVSPEGGHVVPCRSSIHWCLPPCYRAAWSRNPPIGKYSGSTDEFFYVLRDARGRTLNTLYATAKDYPARLLPVEQELALG